MRIIVPETCWADYKFNKPMCGICLDFISTYHQRCRSTTRQIYYAVVFVVVVVVVIKVVVVVVVVALEPVTAFALLPVVVVVISSENYFIILYELLAPKVRHCWTRYFGTVAGKTYRSSEEKFLYLWMAWKFRDGIAELWLIGTLFVKEILKWIYNNFTVK